jgi:hypothetical protein
LPGSSFLRRLCATPTRLHAPAHHCITVVRRNKPQHQDTTQPDHHATKERQGRGGDPRGYRLRPVEAVQIWTTAAGITSGPVFRAVALGGRVSDEVLADDSSYAGHNLRSGFLTSAAESGASVFKMTEVSTKAWTRCMHCIDTDDAQR